MGVIDISSRGPAVAANLSNFVPRKFVFDTIECASLEGILQSLKFFDVDKQRKICGFVGGAAWRAGRAGNGWKKTQTLWWSGFSYERGSQEYQTLITEIYDACYRGDPTFREDLLATGDNDLTHAMSTSPMEETVLTEAEFIGQLLRLRTLG